MTPEEKELLLKDLSARARYKVKIYVPKGKRINIDGKIKEYDLVDTVYGVIFYNDEPKIVTPQNFSFLDKNGINNFGGWSVEMVKPYLRPMSSMTENEKQEYVIVCDIPTEAMDWLNAHHFDYRRLIKTGLALEAPEGMYNIK
jgi:hypothetical protein